MTMVDIVIYSYFISAIIGLICLPWMANKSFKLLAVFWFFSVVVDLNIDRFDSGNGNSIRFFYCIFYPISLLIYIYIFNVNRSWRSVRYIMHFFSSVFVIIVAALEILTNLDDVSSANTVFVAQAFGVFLVVLLYFSDIFVIKRIIFPLKEPLFLVASALLLYTSGNLIATGFFHQLFSYSHELAHTLYNINYIMNILMSILFAASFIFSLKKSVDLSNGN